MRSTFSKTHDKISDICLEQILNTTSKLGCVGGWWLATGSYSVKMKRTASRKLFRRLLGLQDLKNGPKTTKNVEKLENPIFAVFWGLYIPWATPDIPPLAADMLKVPALTD